MPHLMRHLSRTILIAVLACLWVVVATPRAEACPNCRDSVPTTNLENAPPPGSLAKGYAFSIIVMMASPFILVGGFGGALYLTVKRSSAAAQAQAAPASTV